MGPFLSLWVKEAVAPFLGEMAVGSEAPIHSSQAFHPPSRKTTEPSARSPLHVALCIRICHQWSRKTWSCRDWAFCPLSLPCPHCRLSARSRASAPRQRRVTRTWGRFASRLGAPVWACRLHCILVWLSECARHCTRMREWTCQSKSRR